MFLRLARKLIEMNHEASDRTITGTILEIQRMSTEDGPGLRTTVFFKGCSLRCAWCHNPESLERKPEIQWLETKCILCRICLDACPRGALSLTDAGIAIDRAVCEACGTCAGACPSTALELLGTRWTVEGLVGEVMKDAPYFGNTGGITASGGEAALQAPFVTEFFKELKSRGIHTALDTSGQCAREALGMILPYSDILLYDMKEIDPERHRRFTGTTNGHILDNLVYAAEFVRGHLMPRGIWIRTPVIPGMTDRPDNMAGIGRFIADRLGDVVTRWELCAFNNLCADKYRRLGREWPFGSAGLIGRDVMEELCQAARSSGVDPGIVAWTGATDRGADTGVKQAQPAAKRTPSC
jgi:pyruvate formate lyase activating enzyme